MSSDSHVSETTPALTLFPEYNDLYDLIAREVEGLSDEQFDFASDRWGWSEWSIRRQLSHMASLLYRWLLIRWGDTLFPDGDHGVADVQGLAQSDFDRRMDESRYGEISVVMDKLQEAIDLARSVLRNRTVGFVRSNKLDVQLSDQWDIMRGAHPTGLTVSEEDPATGTMTLEATFRHMYFEETTHLYNVQRLKRAQGLDTVVDIPEAGYWALDGWDRSEP